MGIQFVEISAAEIGFFVSLGLFLGGAVLSLIGGGN